MYSYCRSPLTELDYSKLASRRHYGITVGCRRIGVQYLKTFCLVRKRHNRLRSFDRRQYSVNWRGPFRGLCQGSDCAHSAHRKSGLEVEVSRSKALDQAAGNGRIR